MEKITTHVLDTTSGLPAAGVLIRLFRGEELVSEAVTNEDGRCDKALLENGGGGTYRLEFAIGDYFKKAGVASPFLEVVPIQFVAEAGQSYHVPLVCTPWSYSTYRGS